MLLGCLFLPATSPKRAVLRGARKASSPAARGLYLRIILHTSTCSAIVRPAFLPQEFRGSEIRLRCYRHMEVEKAEFGDAMRCAYCALPAIIAWNGLGANNSPTTTARR